MTNAEQMLLLARGVLASLSAEDQEPVKALAAELRAVMSKADEPTAALAIALASTEVAVKMEGGAL